MLEPFEILRQMPGDFIARTNRAVERHGGDGFEGLHSAAATTLGFLINRVLGKIDPPELVALRVQAFQEA